MALQQTIHYFAYASNLNEAQLVERGILVVTRRLATLRDYELVFNKRGVLYPGYAAANVQPHPGSQVEGVGYELPEEALAQLDMFEIGYEKKVATVVLQEDGSLKQAIIYVAKPDFIVTDLHPSKEYLRRIFEGGKGVFSEDYLQKLENQIL